MQAYSIVQRFVLCSPRTKFRKITSEKFHLETMFRALFRKVKRKIAFAKIRTESEAKIRAATMCSEQGRERSHSQKFERLVLMPEPNLS